MHLQVRKIILYSFLGITSAAGIVYLVLMKPTASAPAASLVYFWSGAVTHHSARVTAKVDRNLKVRLALSTDSLSFANAVYTDYSEATVEGKLMATFHADSLQPFTTYYYKFQQENGEFFSPHGRFKTFPKGADSFTLAFSACGYTGSERSVYRVIKEQNPLLYLVTGDFFYGDITSDCERQFEVFYDSTLSSKAQAQLYRNLPIAYMWDDHDFGPGNSDGKTFCKAIAKKVYSAYVPHYPLALAADTTPISQVFTVGRVKILMTDLRSEKQKPVYDSCTLLEPGSNFGTRNHLEWFKKELLLCKENRQLAVWVSGIPFINYPGGPNYQCNEDDDWGGYQKEREEIIRFVADNNINLCILSGDAHMVAIDDGTHSGKPYIENAGIPVFHAASLDQKGSYKGGPYSHGYSPGSGHFGLMTVTDTGTAQICVKWKAMNEKNVVVKNTEGRPIEFEFCRIL